MPLPAWLARMSHEPVAITVIESPLTEQVSGVSDASDTASAELAVALAGKVTGAPEKVCGPGSAKVIVWGVFDDTEKLSVTDAAAE